MASVLVLVNGNEDRVVKRDQLVFVAHAPTSSLEWQSIKVATDGETIHGEGNESSPLRSFRTISTTNISESMSLVLDLDGPGLQKYNIDATGGVTITLSTANRSPLYVKELSVRFIVTGGDLELIYPQGIRLLNDQEVERIVTDGTELSLALSCSGVEEADVVWSTLPIMVAL